MSSTVPFAEVAPVPSSAVLFAVVAPVPVSACPILPGAPSSAAGPCSVSSSTLPSLP